MTKEYKVTVDDDGTEAWYNLKGELHRDDGPARISLKGTKEWFLHNKYHRENGPAVEFWNGTWEYRIHGKLHNEYGPAVKLENGILLYYLDDEEYSEFEYKQELEARKRRASIAHEHSKACHEDVIVEKGGKKYKLVPID